MSDEIKELKAKLRVARRDYEVMYKLQQAGEKELNELKRARKGKGS